MNKDFRDLLASRDILKANIEMFHAGTRELYRVVASELRKLTCDGRSTLLSRISPNVTLHPLPNPWGQDEHADKVVFQINSIIHCDGKGGSRIVKMFDDNAPPIPLENWLDQSLLNQNITIKELIRSVADKEGAHSDKRYNDTLLLTKSVKLVSEDSHKQHIIAIGEYVLGLVDHIVQSNPKVFVSPDH